MWTLRTRAIARNVYSTERGPLGGRRRAMACTRRRPVG